MMPDVILKIENISKQYRLGLIGTGTISHDLNRWWSKVRGKEDPFLLVGDVNNRATKGQSDYVWALKDINFEVKRGEVLGIIGKNGAGKSTLLKILSRVTSPTTGEIKTKGRIASLLEVGTGFHPEMTGRENIFLNGAILGMTKAEISSKIDEIIEFSGCQRYIDTPVKRYSSGMTVRLAFAVAAHLEPDILIIDEVLAVGDAEFQKKAIGKMQDISKSDGRTVLFVSHNMAAVSNLCKRVIVLQNGSTYYDGKTDNAITKYLNYKNFSYKTDFPLLMKGFNLEGFNIYNDIDIESKSLILGKPCSFKITFFNKDYEKKINMRLQVYNSKGLLVSTLNTYHVHAENLFGIDELKQFECKVEKLNIANGNYYVALQIIDLNNRIILYENDRIAEFNVEKGDFFNSGRLPSSENTGIVLIDYNWEVK